MKNENNTTANKTRKGITLILAVLFILGGAALSKTTETLTRTETQITSTH